MVPSNYTPVNGITGDESTAILFVPYQACGERWMFVGVTVKPPSDAPGETSLSGYLLGTFVEDEDGNARAIVPGPTEVKAITHTTWNGISQVEVAGSITMSAAHEGRNELTSSSPFAIRLFHESEGSRSTLLLTASGLERENSAGTFEADSLFGHEIPAGVPIQFVGSLKDLTLLRLE